MFAILFAGRLAASAATGTSLTDILSAATELLTWVVTSMGSFLNFVMANAAISILFGMVIISFAVGLLFRVWGKVGPGR